ncbi:MAG TPA: hypothetical protein VLL54_01610 [Pyrinomonadaceae bacterium]|nr:hypothetical protein [Pyrinomonadaceae bacterium]
MPLFGDPHRKNLRDAGWHSRGYLPHFDGAAKPQFVTFHLADSIPRHVLQHWRDELKTLNREYERIVLQRRIEHYLDYGYGEAFLKRSDIAEMAQDSLLKFDGIRYQLFAWVVMPNNVHTLLTRFEGFELSNILQAIKSFTAHQANKTLGRTGQFWMLECFDRYIRSEKHFDSAVTYIENNPVKAKLCQRPEEWPFSSASFKQRK